MLALARTAACCRGYCCLLRTEGLTCVGQAGRVYYKMAFHQGILLEAWQGASCCARAWAGSELRTIGVPRRFRAGCAGLPAWAGLGKLSGA